VQKAVLHADIDVSLLDPWHFQDDRQRVLRLIDVCSRKKHARGDRCLFALLVFPFLLDLKLLSLGHGSLPLLKVYLADLDRAGFLPLSPRQQQRQHAILVFCLDAIGIELNRQRQGAIELAGDTLTPVDAAFGINGGLLA
jgi:hypothetical protein